MKVSGGRNLHPMLLREIERPLITITLRETNGNQIQAAHLLGMNRNTLRKKIKELKIRVYKTPQNNPQKSA
jgi:two-component system nitrogen regulation response regulator GlnG